MYLLFRIVVGFSASIAATAISAIAENCSMISSLYLDAYWIGLCLSECYSRAMSQPRYIVFQ